MSRQRSCYAPLRRIVLIQSSTARRCVDGFRTVRSRNHHRHGQGRAGRHRPRRDRDGDEHSDPAIQHHRYRRQRFLHISEPDCRPLRARRRAERLQERSAGPTCSSTRPAQLALDFTLETGALTEEVTVTAETTPLQTRSRSANRSRPRTSSCCRSPAATRSACRRSRPASSAATSTTPASPSLTNGGFSINGGRGDENTITVDGAVAIRTRSSGATIGVQNVDVIQEVQVLTGELHARIRTRQRRADPVRDQERQQPLQRERVVLLPRRFAAGQHVGAQREPERDRELRPGAVRLQAVRLLVRRPDSLARCSRTSCSSSARRSGSTSSPIQTNTAVVPTAAMRNGDFSQLLGTNPFFSIRAADHSRSGHRPAVPEQHHPDEPAVARTASRCMNTVSAADRRASSQGAEQLDLQQRQPAGSAEGQHPVRLPAEQRQPVHLPLLKLQLGGD